MFADEPEEESKGLKEIELCIHVSMTKIHLGTI